MDLSACRGGTGAMRKPTKKTVRSTSPAVPQPAAVVAPQAPPPAMAVPARRAGPSGVEMLQIRLYDVDDRSRVVAVRWSQRAIPHTYRDVNGLIYSRTGQVGVDGLLGYRTTEKPPPPPKTIMARFEFGPAAARQPDTGVPDPPPPTYDLNGHTYTFFAWADANQHVPIYRCLDA